MNAGIGVLVDWADTAKAKLAGVPRCITCKRAAHELEPWNRMFGGRVCDTCLEKER